LDGTKSLAQLRRSGFAGRICSQSATLVEKLAPGKGTNYYYFKNQNRFVSFQGKNLAFFLNLAQNYSMFTFVSASDFFQL